jgi:hypothetical protein
MTADAILLVIAGYVVVALWSHDFIRDYGYYSFPVSEPAPTIDAFCSAAWLIHLPIAMWNYLVGIVYDFIEDA